MAQRNFKNTKVYVDFDEASSRQQLNSGDNISTLFGKIKKIFSDLKSVCFTGNYKDLSDTPTTATKDTDGLMSAEDKTKLDGADDTYALKSLYGDTTINVGRKAGTPVGVYSVAEGVRATASGVSSHAEGDNTTASRDASHAEGSGTTASGVSSHAEGSGTTASGKSSHAGGSSTKALHDNEVAYGKYNESNDNTLFSIGDGTAADARHNAFEITTTGGKLHDKDIATTDLIPTELPANGGNADTVGLRYSNDFLGKDYVYPTFMIFGYGTDLNNYVAEYHGFIYNCENSPIAHEYGFLDVSFYDGIGFTPSPPDKGGVVLQRFTRVDNCAFTRMRYANVWSDWKELSTTPIKSTTFSGATDAYSNIALWAKSENKIPILFECEDKNAAVFYGTSGNFYAYVTNHLHQNVAETAVSGTVWYVEV